MSVFGQIKGSVDAEQAVKATLEEWLPTYLAEVCRQRSITLAAVPRPRSVIVTKDFDGWPEDRLPCVQIVSPGMLERPDRDPEGFGAWFQVNVFAVVQARDRDATRRLRGVYEDAIPACLMQHQRLGGPANGVQWLGAGSGEVPVDQRDDRTLQGSVIALAVRLEEILDPVAGPAAPDPEPPASGSNPRTLDGLPAYPDDPTVLTADVTVEPDALT